MYWLIECTIISGKYRHGIDKQRETIQDLEKPQWQEEPI